MMQNNTTSGLVRRSQLVLSGGRATLWSQSDVFAAVGAQDVIFGRQEAAAHQGHAALLAVEAVVVPLALLERDVLAASET